MRRQSAGLISIALAQLSKPAALGLVSSSSQRSSDWSGVELIKHGSIDVPHRCLLPKGSDQYRRTCAAAAALAATAHVLNAEYNGQAAKLRPAKAYEGLATTLFEKHVDQPGSSYAKAYPELAAAWPASNSSLASKQFYATAWMSGLTGNKKEHRNIVNYYFSFAEETHDWAPCTVDQDSLFVEANLVMAHFETFDPRHRLHVQRCVAAWTGQRVRAPLLLLLSTLLPLVRLPMASPAVAHELGCGPQAAVLRTTLCARKHSIFTS